MHDNLISLYGIISSHLSYKTRIARCFTSVHELIPKSAEMAKIATYFALLVSFKPINT